jgi:hypothetical protein
MSSEPSSSAAKDELDAPILLTPGQIATVAGGTVVTVMAPSSGSITSTTVGGPPTRPTKMNIQ